MLPYSKISIVVFATIAMVIGSAPISYSSETTFKSLAACEARGEALVDRGEIRSYRCVRKGKLWKLRSGSDNDSSGGSVSYRKAYTKRSYRKLSNKRSYRSVSYRKAYSSREPSMAACRAKGRALVRAGKIQSFKCRPII